MTLNEVKQKYQKEYRKPIWLLQMVNNLPILDVEKDWVWQKELQKRISLEASISPEDSNFEAYREERAGLEEAEHDRFHDK